MWCRAESVRWIAASAILIRYAEEAGPLAISFWRCAAGTLAIALAFLLFAETPPVIVYPRGAAIVAGILLVCINRGKSPEIIE
ncbi:MAG: hypothetical protein M3164_07430 [Actinomycetota bacterium]|nr:hypothetical protein [Actinomycetota bacterium]